VQFRAASGCFTSIPAAQVLEFGAYGVAAFDPKRPSVVYFLIPSRGISRGH
jgi:hypothetical protein